MCKHWIGRTKLSFLVTVSLNVCKHHTWRAISNSLVTVVLEECKHQIWRAKSVLSLPNCTVVWKVCANTESGFSVTVSLNSCKHHTWRANAHSLQFSACKRGAPEFASSKFSILDEVPRTNCLASTSRCDQDHQCTLIGSQQTCCPTAAHICSAAGGRLLLTKPPENYDRGMQIAGQLVIIFSVISLSLLSAKPSHATTTTLIRADVSTSSTMALETITTFWRNRIVNSSARNVGHSQ